MNSAAQARLFVLVAVVAGMFCVLLVSRWVVTVWQRRVVAPARTRYGVGFKSVPRLLREKLAEVTERRTPTRYRQHLARCLTAAGSDNDDAVTALLLRQEAAAVAGLLLGCVCLPWSMLPIAVVAGAAIPYSRLQEQVRRRQSRILRDLPWQIDLLMMAVEAGLGFSQAVGRLVDLGRPGPLTDEWGRWLANLRLGVSREVGLRTLAERTGVPAIASLVSALIQADRHGTRLGAVLRLKATQLRQERWQRAERLANEAPVKLLMPLLGCIFPCVFLVLLGPVFFAITTNGAGGGP